MVESEKITRREFLKKVGLMLIATGFVLSGCSERLNANSTNEEGFGEKEEDAKKEILSLEEKLSKEGPVFQWSAEKPSLEEIGSLKIVEFNPEAAPFVKELLAPVLPVAPQAFDTFRSVAPYFSVEERQIWLSMFHWTKHAAQAGFDIHQLTDYSRFLSEIVRGSLNGQGLIIKIAGVGGYPDGYVFIRQAANGSSFMVKIAENGAPITAFETAMKGGKIDPREAARYIEKLKTLGQVIEEDQVPQKIKDLWQNGPPPAIRFWWWTLAYQASQAGSALVDFVGKLPHVPILVVPAYILYPCNNPGFREILPECGDSDNNT